MKKTDIHIRPRIGIENCAAASRRNESRRASTTRVLLRSQSVSSVARRSRAFLYLFIAATQILHVNTASTTHQTQDVDGARNHTTPTRLSPYGIRGTSTVQEHLSRSVLALTPTPVAPKRSLSTTTTTSSSSSLSSSTPLASTTATPQSKLTLSSSDAKTLITESSGQGERQVVRTADTKSSQSKFSRIKDHDLGEKENTDYLVATHSSIKKGDLVYLKRKMDNQRQEIRHLRLQLTQNNDQITSLQKEFSEFRKQQKQIHSGVPPAEFLPTGKVTQTTSETLLSSSSQEQRSSSQHEMLEPLLHLTQLQKEQDFLTSTSANPVTSPDPLPQPATSTKAIQSVTIESEIETTTQSHRYSDCSKSELRLFDLQKELESFQREVNTTFSAFLIKLAFLKLDSQKVPEVVESLKEGSDLKSTEDETVSEKGDAVSREVDGTKSGVMNDAISHAALSKQRTRSKTEEENVPTTGYVDSRSLKHHATQLWSSGQDSERKADDKEKLEISEDGTLDDTVKDDVNVRLSGDVAQELDSINQKVQLISDRLVDLEDQLVYVRENTSLSIKHVKETLRGNSTVPESYLHQQRPEVEKKGLQQGKISSIHSLSDHTIKDRELRIFSKKNDTRRKEKEHQREKNSESQQRKIFPETWDRTSGKFSGKCQFLISDMENVHHNISWLFDNVQSMQNKISHLDNSLSELSSTLSKLAFRFPLEVEDRNETIDGIVSAATEKSTSDQGFQNKSLSKYDQLPNIEEIPEQEETNSSQGLSIDEVWAVNQTEERKSGSQMISDSAEQFPEATLTMLQELMSCINDLDAQIQKLKLAVAVMKTRLMNMLSFVEKLYPKETETKENAKDESGDIVGSSLLLNSTLVRTSLSKKEEHLSPASIYGQLTSSSSPLVNISDVHERFLRNRSIVSYENSGQDIIDSTTPIHRLSNFTDFEKFQRNKSTTVTPKAIDPNVSTAKSRKEIPTPLSTNVRITGTPNISSKGTRLLETALGNVQELLKRVKKLESQMLDLNEEKLVEPITIQADYLGSGTSEDFTAVSREILNKIAHNMSHLQTQIASIKRNMSVHENQLYAVKNDVFILDENMNYLGRELSDLELKQRRDDRFYHSQQIVEADLSLTEVAAQVSQILAPKQQLTNKNLKELNDSLNKQWAVINHLKETTTQQEKNFSRMAKSSHSSQEKILYVDLSKRRYKIYNPTPVVSCNSMKDADRTFLNNKTQTCYYGYGNKLMLPYKDAKRKCEDAGFHMVFMETEEEQAYVAKEITQVIGGHWIGAEKFDHGWYWVRGCDAVNLITEPPWRYNHSVNYKRAIIWGDKWSGKYPSQHYRFVCEEEPFKEEICNGFRSFDKVKDWLPDAFFRSFNTLHEVDCGRLCLADPSCKGFRFRKSGHHKCALYNRSNTTTKKKTTCGAPGEVCYSRIEHCFS